MNDISFYFYKLLEAIEKEDIKLEDINLSISKIRRIKVPVVDFYLTGVRSDNGETVIFSQVDKILKKEV